MAVLALMAPDDGLFRLLWLNCGRTIVSDRV